MKVAVLFSGGKDSTYTLWIALQQYEVISLITVLSGEESYLYHYQKRHIAQTLSEAIGIPVTFVTISEETQELTEVEKSLRDLQVEAILIGGLLSEYQRTRFNNIAKQVNIPCFAPLWRKDQKMLLRDLKNHFKIIFTTIASMGFTGKDLGRVLDDAFFERLTYLQETYGVSIGGEGGEYETLCLDAPFYKKQIVIEEAVNHWDEPKSFGYLEIKHLRLVEK